MDCAVACPRCRRPIHALDEYTGAGNEQRHTDCDRAARIDYASAFDRAAALMDEAAPALQRVITNSAADREYTDKYGDDLMTAWEAVAAATAWRTYQAERGA